MTGIILICDKFPLGGLNRLDVFSSMDFVFYLNQLRLFHLFRHACTTDNQELMTAIFMTYKLQGAYCGEMATLAMNMLKQIAGDIPIEIVSLKHHQFLLIDRDPESDPGDISTWGENAVISDPWARKFYEAQKFVIEQEKGEKIKIIRSINPQTGEITQTEDEYLSGSPRIGFNRV